MHRAQIVAIAFLAVLASHANGQTIIGTSLSIKCRESVRLSGDGEMILHQKCSDGKVYVSSDGAAFTETLTGGTVTSVGFSAPSGFTVAGSPITGAGTITLGLQSQTANFVWAAPNGSAGAPSFRLLASDDIPTLAQSKITNLVSNLAAKAALAGGNSFTGNQMIAGSVQASDNVNAGAFVNAGVGATGGYMGFAVANPVTGNSGFFVLETGGESFGLGAAEGDIVIGVGNGKAMRIGGAAGAASPLVISGVGDITITGAVSVPDSTFAQSKIANLTADLAAKAPLASPTFTGVPAAPTASPGTNTTQLATAQFVTTAVTGLAPIASPAFTGNPTAPTPATSDSDTSIATTAWGKAQETATATLTGKSIALGSNTVTGTLAQLNTAITDAEIARTDAANTFLGAVGIDLAAPADRRLYAAGFTTIGGESGANGFDFVGKGGDYPAFGYNLDQAATGSGGYRYRRSDVAFAARSDSSFPFWLRVAASGTAGNTPTWVDALKIDTAGSVGIGGTATSKLHVFGTATITGATTIDGDVTLSAGRLIISGATKGVRERGRAFEMGEPQTFTPTRTANAGTWTGGTITTARYSLVGNMMTVLLKVDDSSLSSTPTVISVDIPASKTSTNEVGGPLNLKDSGTGRIGSWRVSASGTKIDMTVSPWMTGTWAGVSSTNSVMGVFVFEVNP